MILLKDMILHKQQNSHRQVVCSFLYITMYIRNGEKKKLIKLKKNPVLNGIVIIFSAFFLNLF